jgi:osmotically-inducible protein OsmY
MVNRSGSYGQTSHRGGEREPRGGGGRGRTSRGYTRPDDRIRDDICGHMTGDSHLDASEIEVKVEDGEVLLSGSIADQSERRRAEELTAGISGVKNVRNGLRIRLHGVGTTGNSTSAN